MTAMFKANRVIPPGHQVYKLRLQGETPLLMSSGEADREGDTYRAYEALGRKRGKSLEDQARLRELEWHVGLYWDEKVGAYIPSKNVKELLRSAATKWRKGEDVKRSLVIPTYRIPLIYDGPTTVEGLWKEGYRYMALVTNAGAARTRVVRTRPCFDQWALECEVAIDPEDLDPDDLARIVQRAQKYGLGDYRPEFGAFTASLEFVREQRLDARANGAKPRDKRAEKAQAAHHARVTKAA